VIGLGEAQVATDPVPRYKIERLDGDRAPHLQREQHPTLANPNRRNSSDALDKTFSSLVDIRSPSIHGHTAAILATTAFS
jgi:hypothetical protein